MEAVVAVQAAEVVEATAAEAAAVAAVVEEERKKQATAQHIASAAAASIVADKNAGDDDTVLVKEVREGGAVQEVKEGKGPSKQSSLLSLSSSPSSGDVGEAQASTKEHGRADASASPLFDMVTGDPLNTAARELRGACDAAAAAPRGRPAHGRLEPHSLAGGQASCARARTSVVHACVVDYACMHN